MPPLPRTPTQLRWYLLPPSPLPRHNSWQTLDKMAVKIGGQRGAKQGDYASRFISWSVSSLDIPARGVMQRHGHGGARWDKGGEVRRATRLVTAYREQGRSTRRNIWLGFHLSPLGACVEECCSVCSAMPHCPLAHRPTLSLPPSRHICRAVKKNAVHTPPKKKINKKITFSLRFIWILFIHLFRNFYFALHISFGPNSKQSFAHNSHIFTTGITQQTGNCPVSACTFRASVISSGRFDMHGLF